MIYDSIRQAKPAVRNTFGAGRLNTRLSFYFFEVNRLSFVQNKAFYSKRFYMYSRTFTNKDFLLYLTTIDTTLFSYHFYSDDDLTIGS